MTQTNGAVGAADTGGSRVQRVTATPQPGAVAISQRTTARWGLAQDLASLSRHGFSALSLWRAKVSDDGVEETRAALERSAVRCSSLQHAGGFTGGDGRSFHDSVGDAVDAIAEAGRLGAPVLVLHSGCRGGHTHSHASRLLREALEILVPEARRQGVVLALRPLHPAAARGDSFLTDLAATLDLVAAIGGPGLGIALDLWHFGSETQIEPLLPRLVESLALVQVADRRGPPAADADRLPPGFGSLRLGGLVRLLRQHGYSGDLEFDPVGEMVEVLGYSGTMREIRRVAAAWCGDHVSPASAGCPASGGGPKGPAPASHPVDHLRSAAGSRRSQASSQAVSRG